MNSFVIYERENFAHKSTLSLQVAHLFFFYFQLAFAAPDKSGSHHRDSSHSDQ